MATIITKRGDVEAHEVRTCAYYSFWISASLDLDDGDDASWTEEDIFDEMTTQLGPWLDQAANFGLSVNLEDVREQGYTRCTEHKGEK